MKYSEILRKIDNIFDYLLTHNKNLTKTQYYMIDELRDLIHEMRIHQEA